MPQTMYWFRLVGSIALSHLPTSAADKWKNYAVPSLAKAWYVCVRGGDNHQWKDGHKCGSFHTPQ